MRNTTVIVVMDGRNLKNMFGGFLHGLGLFKILHYVPIFNGNGESVGIRATVRASKPILMVLNKMYNDRPVTHEAFLLQK